MAVTKN